MEIARAIVLTAPGANDPPWSNAGSAPQALVPVATKPILVHTLEALGDAGILDVVVVSETEAAPAFRSAIGDGSRWGVTIRYAPEAGNGRDLAHTLRSVSSLVNDEPALVQHADALLRGRMREHVMRFAQQDLQALVLSVSRAHVPGAPALTAGHLLSPEAMRTLRTATGPGDPTAALARYGSRLQTLQVEGCLACHGGEASLLEANRQALEGLRTDVQGAHLDDCELQGPVVIHPTAVLRRTLVRGPAIIGPRARLTDAYVGPYTSIGADTFLEGTEVEHSIVMDEARLLHVGSRLETSVIGRGACIKRRFDMPSAVRLSIGDGAEVVLS